MDAARFDRLTRAVTTPGSRRALGRALLGGLVAAGLGLVRARPAGAAADADQKCSKDGQCDSGVCYRFGKCKKNGKLTGKCRCGCDVEGDCPGEKVCCNLSPDAGDGVRVCLGFVGQRWTHDPDCCQGLCRGGTCCLAAGGPCFFGAEGCCSKTCNGSVCA